MGQAKQIIFYDDEDNKWKLNEMDSKNELEKILNQEHVRGLPIAILSVIGAFRTGKSFLLSWLLCYFKAHLRNSNWLEQYQQQEGIPLSNVFPWKSGSKSETQGIWAWSEVFIVDGPADGKVGVLLIDTQGLFDGNSTSRQNGNIFTLSTLMSSIQIFNLSQKMQENYLENLQLFSEFGRRALSTQHSDSITNNKPFQRLVFLIRDWQYPKEHPYGSEGGQQYINNYLKATNNNGVEKRELIERRKYVHGCFSQVQCYLMPHPGKKVANDDGNFDGRTSDMKGVFQDHLKELPIFLFPDGAVEPKTVAGNLILAGDVVGHVKVYLDLLNSNESLSPKSVFQAMAIIHNNTVARNAKKEYKTYVTAIEKEFIDTFLTDADIEVKHYKAKKKALDYFGKHKMGDMESNSEISEELIKDMDDEFENWKTRNERAKVEILRLNDMALNDAGKMYSTSMNEWLRNAPPFATSEQLFTKNQEIQETTANYLKSRLKGPNELIPPTNDRLKKLMEVNFLSDINPKNESNKKHELDRLEIEALRIAAEEEANRLRVGTVQSMIRALKFVLLVVLVICLAGVAILLKPKQESTSSWVSRWVELPLSVSSVMALFKGFFEIVGQVLQ